MKIVHKIGTLVVLLMITMFTATAQIGFGTNTPNLSAVVDMAATDKGVLLPRVNLTSTTLQLGASANAQGLMVFNTGSTLPVGYYYWSGSEWRVISSTTAIPPSIGSVNCGGAKLSPSTYTSGTPYIGTLTIPYIGGNGGTYGEGATITVNGLNFKLKPGTLETGGGFLMFAVSGTPTVTSPVGTTIPVQGSTGNNLVTFLTNTQHCNAIVGDQVNADIKEVAFAGPMVLTTAAATGRDGYQFTGTTPDGRFSVRVFCPTALNLADNANLQLRWNGGTSDPATIDIIQNTGYWWNGGGGSQAGQVRYPKNQWAGYNGTSGTLQTATIQSAGNNPTWGDPGVYASNSPEYRYYNWSPFSGSDKVFYQLEFMMASQTPTDVPNATSCPSGTCNTIKVFIKIRQITAL